jgi:hypothetical protein
MRSGMQSWRRRQYVQCVGEGDFGGWAEFVADHGVGHSERKRPVFSTCARTHFGRPRNPARLLPLSQAFSVLACQSVTRQWVTPKPPRYESAAGAQPFAKDGANDGARGISDTRVWMG